MSRYTYRLLEKEDLPSLIALHRDFLGVERDEAFFEWKYWQNPCGPHRCVVAVDQETGAVAGELGSIPVILKFFDVERRAHLEVDIVIADVKERGRIFFRVYRQRLEHIVAEPPGLLPLNLAFTIPKTLKIMGKFWRVWNVAPAPKLTRILRYGPVIGGRIKSLAAGRLAGLVLDGISRLRHPMIAPRGIAVERIPAFDESADRFWKRIREYSPIWTVRSAPYLNWRHVAIPNVDNALFVVREGKDLAGYIVVHVRDQEIRRGIIMDFQFAKDRKDAGRALLARAMKHFFEQEADVAVTWTFRHSYLRPLLGEFGFVPRETTGRNFCVRHAEEMKEPHADMPWEEALKAENWDICKGDADDE